jgi:hypothetical protein
MKIPIKLPTLHSGQQKIMDERKRHNCIDCGRRFGKNILLQELAVEGALELHLPVGWAAPIYKQTLDDWRALDNILSPVITRRSASELRFDLMGGGSIEFWSLDKPDSIRGKKYKRFIVNEAAFVPNLMDIRNFVITPTLIDYQGDSYYSGTPKGRNGFWQLYNQAGEDWAHWQMSSYTNPHIPKSELDNLKDTMTERAFQQEIMAQFLEDGGGVFRFVMDAATAEKQDGGQGQYVIGVDWGRVNDATVFSVLDIETRSQVYIDRMTNTDYNAQRGRLLALWERFNHCAVIAEYNSMGGPQVEALQNMGIPVQAFTTTNASKAQVIQALELAFERRELKILNDNEQVNELLAFESEKLPSGLVRYGAPEGAHDDMVMALALAWWGCSFPSSDKMIDWV